MHSCGNTATGPDRLLLVITKLTVKSNLIVNERETLQYTSHLHLIRLPVVKLQLATAIAVNFFFILCLFGLHIGDISLLYGR